MPTSAPILTFSDALIINSKSDYNLEVNEKTNFIDAIIDNPKFMTISQNFKSNSQ